MTIERGVAAFAGTVVLLSVFLTLEFGPVWLLLTGFVGLNLIQMSITGFCPATLVFRRLGLKPGQIFR